MTEASTQNSPTRLVLGTAQLGSDYGVANTQGKPSIEKAVAIVKTAWDLGVRLFDTASAYGDSEETLGKVLRKLGISDEAKVISKFPIMQKLDASSLRSAVEVSLVKTGVSRLEGMLFHRDMVLDNWDEMPETLRILRSSGLVKKFGVSCYEPERAAIAMNTAGIEMLQVPYNVFDRRFGKIDISSGDAFSGMDIFVRSVFLQGLLLMDPDSISVDLENGKSVLEDLDKIAAEFSIEKDMLALCYVRDRLPDAYVLMGAESPEQVDRNLQIWGSNRLPDDVMNLLESRFNNVPEAVVRPDLWKT